MKELYRLELTVNEGFHPVIYMKKLPVIKETPKGVWIMKNKHTRKWMNTSARNRYAWRTEKEAEKHFLIRKRVRNRYLQAEIDFNTEAIQIVKNRIRNDKRGKK